MDAAFHLTIPLLFLLLVGADKKQVLALLPLSVIADTGRFFNIRKGLHSFFFIFLVLGIVYLLTYVLGKREQWKSIFGISAFYLFSHLLLDLGTYMALFYPFSMTTYALQAKVMLVNLIPVLVLGISFGGMSELEQGVGMVLSEAGLGILLMVALVAIYLKAGGKVSNNG